MADSTASAEMSLVQKNHSFALDSLDVALHALLGGAAGARGGHDDRLARAPVSRCGDREVVGGLQGLDDVQQLVEVAAQAQRVVDDRPDLALGSTTKTARTALVESSPGMIIPYVSAIFA